MVKPPANLSPRQYLRAVALQGALESRAPGETTELVLTRADEIFDWLIQDKAAPAPSPGKAAKGGP